ncbi:MAG: FMN-binding protein [Spirochaetaceae bacterium]|jgi:major membrane immunogen (membrane-anchored lipoprotein)|nr:FMN-binding protein [Spirochaetaceae bacterium]
MNNLSLFACLVLVVSFLFAGCGGNKVLKDGVYTGLSGADDRGAWGEVVITVEGGRVAGCEFVTLQKDGSAKDGDYGKINGVISNQDFYNKAQFAVNAASQYARTFEETGDLKSVDAVSGATIAYNQFTEAVEAALEKARK